MTYNDALASSDKRTSCVDIFDSVVLLPDQLHLPRIRSKRSATLIWYIVQIKHDSMKDTQKNQRTIEAGVVLSFRRNRAEFIWRKSSQKDVKQSENQSSC